MTNKTLNRTTVRIVDGVNREAVVRFKRASELVIHGKAEWIYHPIDDPGHQPTIRMVRHLQIESQLGYDRIRRVLSTPELGRIPFAGDKRKLIHKQMPGQAHWPWSAAVRRNSAKQVNGTGAR